MVSLGGWVDIVLWNLSGLRNEWLVDNVAASVDQTPDSPWPRRRGSMTNRICRQGHPLSLLPDTFALTLQLVHSLLVVLITIKLNNINAFQITISKGRSLPYLSENHFQTIF